MAKLVAHLQTEDSFGRNGKLATKIKDDWVPSTFSPDFTAHQAKQKKRLGVAAQNHPTQEILYEL